MTKSDPAHMTDYQRSDKSESDDLVPARNRNTAPELLNPGGRSTESSGNRNDAFNTPSFSNYSNRELEGLVHVLIYRIDVLLASLKLADWGGQDFTRTIEETEAILNEGAMHDVGRGMDRMIRAYENVARAAMATARYSMLAPGFTESSEQLQQALADLEDIQRSTPSPTASSSDPA